MRSLFVFLMTCVVSGCGSGSFVVLEITGTCGGDPGMTCVIPDEVDGAIVQSFDAENLETPLVDELLDFTGQTFPITVSLELSDATPTRLTERVLLQLAGNTVGSAAVEHSWESGKASRVLIEVDVP